MSISGALSNALSGLNVATRQAEIISDNVANALTPGYTRKTLDINSSIVDGAGAGAQVTAVRLAQDPIATAERRRVDAESGLVSSRAATQSRLSDALGEPGDPRALAEKAAAFETSLITSANDPGSETSRYAVVSTGKDLAATINQIATDNQRIRMEADASIADQVGQLNSALKEIDVLNREIQMRSVGGGDTAALINQRDAMIDRVSQILPIKTAKQPNDQVALFSANGATLLDGKPAVLEFAPTGIITSDMTLASGALSGLTLNGRPVDIGQGSSAQLLDGGALSAAFEARDVTIPAFDAELDALSADIIMRFQDPSVDPTLTAIDAGFFTDGGTALDVVNTSGLAGRIEINAGIDPEQGGDLWRVRDGLNAVAPSASGSSQLLSNLLDAANRSQAVAGLSHVSAAGMSGHAALLTEGVASRSADLDGRQAYLSGYGDTLREAEGASIGVDTDTELQRLLLVEQAYSANARVLSVADTLIQTLLEI